MPAVANREIVDDDLSDLYERYPLPKQEQPDDLSDIYNKYPLQEAAPAKGEDDLSDLYEKYPLGQKPPPLAPRFAGQHEGSIATEQMVKQAATPSDTTEQRVAEWGQRGVTGLSLEGPKAGPAVPTPGEFMAGIAEKQARGAKPHEYTEQEWRALQTSGGGGRQGLVMRALGAAGESAPLFGERLAETRAEEFFPPETPLEYAAEWAGGTIGGFASFYASGKLVESIPGMSGALKYIMSPKNGKMGQLSGVTLMNALTFALQSQTTLPANAPIGERISRLTKSQIDALGFTTANALRLFPKIWVQKLEGPAIYGVGYWLAKHSGASELDAHINAATLMLFHVATRHGDGPAGERQFVAEMERWKVSKEEAGRMWEEGMKAAQANKSIQEFRKAEKARAVGIPDKEVIEKVNQYVAAEAAKKPTPTDVTQPPTPTPDVTQPTTEVTPEVTREVAKPPIGEDYRGVHRAPTGEFGEGSLAAMDRTYPADVYGSDAARVYGDKTNPRLDAKAAQLIRSLRGKPDSDVKVYRAVPKGAQTEIAEGDWVTPVREYAESHGKRFAEGYDIIVRTAKAGDLFTEGNSLFEYGWQPKATEAPADALKAVPEAPGRAIPPTPAMETPPRATGAPGEAGKGRAAEGGTPEVATARTLPGAGKVVSVTWRGASDGALHGDTFEDRTLADSFAASLRKDVTAKKGSVIVSDGVAEGITPTQVSKKTMREIGYVREGDRYVFKGVAKEPVKTVAPTPEPVGQVTPKVGPQTATEAANEGTLTVPRGRGFPELWVEARRADGKTAKVHAGSEGTLKGSGPYTSVRVVDSKGNDVTTKYPPKIPRPMAEEVGVKQPKEPTTVQEKWAQKADQTAKQVAKEEKGGFLALGRGATEETPAGTGEARKVLEAGRQGQSWVGRVAEAIARPVRALTNQLRFYPRLRDKPELSQFLDNIRTQFMPMRLEQGVIPVSNMRKAATDLTRRVYGQRAVNDAIDILVLEDLKYRLSKGQEVAGGLTEKQIDAELSRLSKSGDAGRQKAVSDTVARLKEVTKDLGKMLVAEGKLDESKLNDPYFRHYVMDYVPEWAEGLIFPMAKQAKPRFRGYLQKALGSKRIIETSEEAFWKHASAVMLDTAQDNWFLSQMQKYDARARLPTGTSLRDGQVFNIGGKRYKAYEWKKTTYEIPAITEAKVQEAAEAGMSVQDVRDMGWLKPARAKGRAQIFVLPEEVADTMKNIRDIRMSEQSRQVMEAVNKITGGWKKFTLSPGAAGLQYHVNNLFGDFANVAVSRPGSLRQVGTAIRVMNSVVSGDTKGLSPFEAAVRKIAVEKQVVKSGQEAELRSKFGVAGLWGKVKRGYATFSEYREGVLRVANVADNLQRAQSGKAVDSGLFNIPVEGLDAESAIGKVARETSVDYLAVPETYKRWVSGLTNPFIRFHEANARNYARIFTQGKTAAKFLAEIAVPYLASMAWNNTGDRTEDEEKLPEWIRNRLHVNLGKDAEGQTVVWAPQNPVDMAGSWIGADNIPRILSDVLSGRMDKTQAAKEMGFHVMAGTPENVRMTLAPWIQFWDGTLTNRDPFTNRTVMPQDLHDRLIRSKTTPERMEAFRLALPYLVQFALEKALTPTAPFQRTQIGGDPAQGLLDYLSKGPLNIQKAVGVYRLDLRNTESYRTSAKRYMDEAKEQVLKNKAEQLWRIHGRDPKQEAALLQNASSLGLVSPETILAKYAQSAKGRIAVIDWQLKTEKDPAKRKVLLDERSNIINASLQKPKGGIGIGSGIRLGR